ncbi:hypothetical protein DICVIV_11895 [Dictyocaulus viviparus]|uniref:Uncharacterized protein n=1 Tax=Dictyocaulus viviparus TaxID=29172 RepID=A0A0D8XC10_DICVI|nr:hypothetical protein DICVIV_11895 [Dictyocaulus viviparus]
MANRYQRQIEILVGNPLKSHHDPSRLQTKVGCIVNFLKNKKEFLVHLYDERHTTIMANDRLKVLQISSRKRREIIDSLSATIMLQEYLDFHCHNDTKPK